VLALQGLTRSADARIAEIASKAAKEVAYHFERSGDWVIRLGDGTEESHRKAQDALDALWMYTGEMLTADPIDVAMVHTSVGIDPTALAPTWAASVGEVLREATLSPPNTTYMQGSGGRGGKQGVHTEYLGHLLAEMQFLQRAYPGARW
jgi:ring-1,2-phenylacetyl-CoA epoxidase subunit PaaC